MTSTCSWLSESKTRGEVETFVLHHVSCITRFRRLEIKNRPRRHNCILVLTLSRRGPRAIERVFFGRQTTLRM